MISKKHYVPTYGLNNLLQDNDQAKEYFMALPDYVQGMLLQRTTDIHSETDLKDYAQVLLNRY